MDEEADPSPLEAATYSGIDFPASVADVPDSFQFVEDVSHKIGFASILLR